MCDLWAGQKYNNAEYIFTHAWLVYSAGKNTVIQYLQHSQNQSASSLILSFGGMHLSWWNHSSHCSQNTITFLSSGLRQTDQLYFCSSAACHSSPSVSLWHIAELWLLCIMVKFTSYIIYYVYNYVFLCLYLCCNCMNALL